MVEETIIQQILTDNNRGTSNINLNTVTTATSGTTVDVSRLLYKTVFINVSVNTGAVTVETEASPDGTTWYQIHTKTYTSTTAKELFNYSYYFPYIRTKTITQSDSTVTTTIIGHS